MNAQKPHTYYVSVGSNIPDAAVCVADALRFLDNLLDGCRCSDVYRTPPMGGKPVADYTNAVACGESTLDPERMTAVLKEYERDCGRTREDSRRGVVVIDLDLVTADGQVLRPRDYEARHFRIGFGQLNQ